MKKFIGFLLSILSVGLVYYYQEEIVSYILKEWIYNYEVPMYQNNVYAKNIDYNYVKMTDNFYPKNETDIKNIFYTILNSGMNSYDIFCEEEYTNCFEEIRNVATDHSVLANINNLVHPYNKYKKLFVPPPNIFGKITIQVSKLYSQQEIAEINYIIEQIKKHIINDNMSNREKIKAFHDFIINNTKYDLEMAKILEQNPSATNINNSDKATGVLNNHLALCSGYTDLMAIFLSSIGIPNYNVSSSNHIWNAVYIDNNWYHLDLTWDDPVTNTGENVIIYDYFLITTQRLEQLDTNRHRYDKTVYGF